MPDTGSPMHNRGTAPQLDGDARIEGLLVAINSNSRQSLLDFLRVHLALQGPESPRFLHCAEGGCRGSRPQRGPRRSPPRRSRRTCAQSKNTTRIALRRARRS